MSTQEFNQLLLQNSEYLRPFAVTLTKDQESAKDLLQETMFRALSNQEKYSVGTNIKAWLYTIMRNIFINNYRRKSKQNTIFDNSPNEFLLDHNQSAVPNGAETSMRMKDINKARAEVYGSENRDPLSIGQIGKIHKDTLTEHFAKSPKEQLAAEKEATQRLRDAKHLGAKNNTLDESEKLDTVRHETDEEGRTHVGFASKGVAGHALYTSGHGENMKQHVINTCPGQTTGCGGGVDEPRGSYGEAIGGVRGVREGRG
jgi:RNA polymerase sigma factor (sigma-70 family)